MTRFVHLVNDFQILDLYSQISIQTSCHAFYLFIFEVSRSFYNILCDPFHSSLSFSCKSIGFLFSFFFVLAKGATVPAEMRGTGIVVGGDAKGIRGEAKGVGS